MLAKHSTSLHLAPLEREDTERLLDSVFGDVPNVGILSNGIHAIAAGNPRASMDLAQHLVDKGLVRYEGGSWTLPPRLDATDLPSSAEDAIRARIAALSPLARWLSEAQALATYQAFTRDDYAKVRPDATPSEIDSAITELVSQQAVVGDGRVYSLAHRGWGAALTMHLPDTDRAERHRALASLYEGRLGLGGVRHALLGGLEARALDELSPLLAGMPETTGLYDMTELGSAEVAATFARALAAAERLGRSGREVNELRRWLTSLSVVSDDAYYWRAAPLWLERLKRDSGFATWEEQTDAADPGARLSRAMQLAFERYGATPETERVYRPDEAVKSLAHYVGISLAIGSSRLDLPVIESLPSLLEPFAPISPLVHAIWQNSIAARENICRGQPERSHARWLVVYERLGEIGGAERQFVDVFRHAIAHALGSVEALMGMESAARWAETLDVDPLQRINGLYLQRIVRLQHGDWDGAERLRKQAEIWSLQARARQMFTNVSALELIAFTMARDLTGLKQCTDRIRSLAARSPGWAPYVRLAQGQFQLICDNFEAAQSEFEGALELVTPAKDKPYPLHAAWCLSVAGYVEALIGRGRNEEARAIGEDALTTCGRLEITVPSHGISRALALAEATLGDAGKAEARLDAVIKSQTKLGITGLHLGASYEARARVAIRAGDLEAVDKYAGLTAREYRHGAGSPLGARYARLMDEALRAKRSNRPIPSDSESDPNAQSGLRTRTSAIGIVTETMKGAERAKERAERALRLLCNARAAPMGHLYLLGDRGIRLVASYGVEMPPEGLLEFIQALIDNPGRR